ncbi:MAG: type IV pilus modification protein PilV [Halothiobacillus sp.]|nr:type IV pilus modification protein PilV [Halothiobacillus sp.]
MQTANNPTPRQHQRGVGLIEVLIAVLVLSIGFLGIAALQAKSLSGNSSAMMRTQANIAAYSMFDAMRADRAAALAGNYDGTVTVGTCPTATGTLAEAQLRTWCLGYDPNFPPSTANPIPSTLLGGLAAVGPAATGTIRCLGAAAGAVASNCSITITFDDSKADGGSAAQSLVFWTQL